MFAIEEEYGAGFVFSKKNLNLQMSFIKICLDFKFAMKTFAKKQE